MLYYCCTGTRYYDTPCSSTGRHRRRPPAVAPSVAHPPSIAGRRSPAVVRPPSLARRRRRCAAFGHPRRSSAVARDRTTAVLSLPSVLVARIFGAVGCSRLRGRKHFLVGSRYPSPNPNPNPNPNPIPKRARNAAAPVFENYLLCCSADHHIALGQ